MKKRPVLQGVFFILSWMPMRRSVSYRTDGSAKFVHNRATPECAPAFLHHQSVQPYLFITTI